MTPERITVLRSLTRINHATIHELLDALDETNGHRQAAQEQLDAKCDEIVRQMDEITQLRKALDKTENELFESKSQVGRLLSALYDTRNVAMRAIRDIEGRLTDEDPTETKIREGWPGAGHAGKVVGPPVWTGDQWWVAIIFEGGKDPEFRKARSLKGFERLAGFTPEKA